VVLLLRGREDGREVGTAGGGNKVSGGAVIGRRIDGTKGAFLFGVARRQG
jgi:hypothetical protein